MSCPEIASSLSAKYRNTSFDGIPTRGSSSSPTLNDYLATHGLLLTMCFPNSCSFGFHAEFFSGSWINQDLGTRVIPSESGIGLILDPSLTDIQCLYPTDAGTLSRDANGCGPMIYDRHGGSQGAASYKRNPIKRYFARKYLTDYKNLNFGQDTRWEDIDCSQFFDLPPIAVQRIWGFLNENGNNSTSIQYYSLPNLFHSNIGAIMGHELCSVKVLPEPQKRPFPLYYDSASWAPDQFKEVIDLEMEFIHNQTTGGDWIWNEFVFSLPVELPPLVQGVSYVNENYIGQREKRREAAHRQAKTFGDLPVFVMHNKKDWDGDVLECDSTTDEKDVMDFEQDKSTSLSHNEALAIMRIQTHLDERRYERRPLQKMLKS